MVDTMGSASLQNCCVEVYSIVLWFIVQGCSATRKRGLPNVYIFLTYMLPLNDFFLNLLFW